jgi:hypothetical protein
MQRAIGERTHLFGYFIKLHATPPELEGRVATWTSQNWPREGMLETFALADHTTTLGFELAPDGRAHCSPPLSLAANSIAWGVREQQAVIRRFVENLTDAVDPRLYSVEELAVVLKTCSIASFKHFCSAPSRDEASAYGGASHAGDQNHLHATELAPQISDVEAIWMLFNRQARNRRTAWYYGSLARSPDPSVAGCLIRSSRAVSRMRTIVAKRRKAWMERRASRRRTNGSSMSA